MADKHSLDDDLVALTTFAIAPEAQMVHELLANNGIACLLIGAGPRVAAPRDPLGARLGRGPR